MAHPWLSFGYGIDPSNMEEQPWETAAWKFTCVAVFPQLRISVVPMVYRRESATSADGGILMREKAFTGSRHHPARLDRTAASRYNPRRWRDAAAQRLPAAFS
jgi:hypothetical protein